MQCASGGWNLFESPVSILHARRPSEVRSVLEEVQCAVNEGLCAAGFLTYEAASGLDPAFHTHRRSGCLPLVWFGLFRVPKHLPCLDQPCQGFHVAAWRASESETSYSEAVHRIREYIYRGDTYQVNYSIRLRTRFAGSPYSLFHALCVAQRSRYCAFLETDDFAICSASPELFIKIDGSSIQSRPMKGTSPRGMTTADDREVKASLAASEKNRAENVMIVDMIRNDLGKISEVGSVRVSRLFEIEKYPTVFQMVSTVEARTDAPFSQIVAAAFPCASITGAPKVRTMDIIHKLEKTPRGIYTGMIGCLMPGGRRGGKTWREGSFNVAIRTVSIDKRRKEAEYGTGGGILWDSDPTGEYAECMTKARVLTHSMPEFELLETVLWTPVSGYVLLERHMSRMADSAEYFDFPFNPALIASELMQAASAFGDNSYRVRMTLNRQNQICIDSRAIEQVPSIQSLRVVLARTSVDSGDPFLYHKTTNRTVYDAAKKAYSEYDDVILQNERGEVTEGCIGNIVAQMGRRLVTPPVSSGILPGTFRGFLLSKNRILEGVLLPSDLGKAKRLFLINSVRGWIPLEYRYPGAVHDYCMC